MADEVLYSQRGRVALITLNRPEYANAQNSAMTYALDAAFARAVNDDGVAVLVLAGAGKHFCAGHDIGTPERDADKSFDREAVLWWDHVGKEGADARYAREMEVYLGMCRRWREIPKPSIAMVHGACIAGGLMLAWVCDLIVASEDAFFADPVVKMGIPGVEYFAHPWVLGPRFAKEVLFTGGRFGAERAYQVGMVSRVVPREELETVTFELAGQIGQMPRFGLRWPSGRSTSARTRWGCGRGWIRCSGCTTWRTRTTRKCRATRWPGSMPAACGIRRSRGCGRGPGRRSGWPRPARAGSGPRPGKRPSAPLRGRRGAAYSP